MEWCGVNQLNSLFLEATMIVGDVSGVNNQFLVETTHEVAVKYNDRSPLENMHCATLGCLMEGTG